MPWVITGELCAFDRGAALSHDSVVVQLSAIGQGLAGDHQLIELDDLILAEDNGEVSGRRVDRSVDDSEHIGLVGPVGMDGHQ
jgi:hypothetical protein